MTLRTLIEVRRLEDDVRGLATQLQADLFRIIRRLRHVRPARHQVRGHTFFRLLLAAASMILRPVTVLPVNATLSTSLCPASAAPPTEPSEGTVFTTPGGNLRAPRACVRTDVSAKGISGGRTPPRRSVQTVSAGDISE